MYYFFLKFCVLLAPDSWFFEFLGLATLWQCLRAQSCKHLCIWVTLNSPSVFTHMHKSQKVALLQCCLQDQHLYFHMSILSADSRMIPAEAGCFVAAAELRTGWWILQKTSVLRTLYCEMRGDQTSSTYAYCGHFNLSVIPNLLLNLLSLLSVQIRFLINFMRGLCLDQWSRKQLRLVKLFRIGQKI